MYVFLTVVEAPPSETQKQTAGRAGAGNVEAPAPNVEAEQENRIRVPLGRSARKERAVVVVGE
jgi:hypothetical protein